MDGTIIDVRVFTREGIDKDKRAIEIEETQIEQVKKNLIDELRINQDTVFVRAKNLLLNKTVSKPILDLKAGSKLSSSVLEAINNEDLFKIQTKLVALFLCNKTGNVL